MLGTAQDHEGRLGVQPRGGLLPAWGCHGESERAYLLVHLNVQAIGHLVVLREGRQGKRNEGRVGSRDKEMGVTEGDKGGGREGGKARQRHGAGSDGERQAGGDRRGKTPTLGTAQVPGGAAYRAGGALGPRLRLGSQVSG